MIVVTIVGILAGIAVPGFKRYIYRARATEGVAFLQEIRARQETYRLDNGLYADPDVNPSAVPADGEPAAFDRTDADWVQLGALPDATAVRFQYDIRTGNPGTADTALGIDGSDFWYVATATADLDGDGTTFFFESYSGASHIYCSNTNGYE